MRRSWLALSIVLVACGSHSVEDDASVTTMVGGESSGSNADDGSTMSSTATSATTRTSGSGDGDGDGGPDAGWDGDGHGDGEPCDAPEKLDMAPDYRRVA